MYQRAHPEKKSKAWYKWAKNHPEISKLDRHNRAQATASRKDWVRRNPERNRVLKMAAAHRRKARKTGAGGSFTASEWICLKSQFDNCCVACGRSDEQLKVLGLVLAADHILPLSKGGTSNIENIQPLCHGTGGCNNKKGATYVDYRLSALRR